MPNLTHSLDHTAVPLQPLCPTQAEGSRGPGISQVFALLMIPVIVLGYHLAVTVLKLFGQRHD